MMLDGCDEDAPAPDAVSFAGAADGAADLDEDDLIASRPFNQRITLPTGPGEMMLDGDAEGVDEEADDEELTREKLKKASMQIQHVQDRKKRGKGKGKKSKGASFDLETFTESPRRGQRGLLS